MSECVRVSLSKKPSRRKDKHLWADYFEIVCLLSLDQEISTEDIEKMIDNSDKIEPEEDADCDELEMIIDGDLSFDEADVTSPEDNGPDQNIDGTASEEEDFQSNRAREIFDLLIERSFLYEDNYPFTIDGTALVRRSNCYQQCAPYIFMLVCSNTRMIIKEDGKSDGSTASKYRHDFEKCSCEFTKRILPTFEVYQFHKDFFDITKLNDRLKKLAEVLGERSNKEAIDDLADQDTGDKGIDVLAYYDFKDSTSASAIVLGQCATSPKDWKDKQKQTDKVKGNRLLCGAILLVLYSISLSKSQKALGKGRRSKNCFDRSTPVLNPA